MMKGMPFAISEEINEMRKEYEKLLLKQCTENNVDSVITMHALTAGFLIFMYKKKYGEKRAKDIIEVFGSQLKAGLEHPDTDDNYVGSMR